MNTKTKDNIREHLTVLLRRRSVIALCCAVLTLMLSFYGIISGVIRTIDVLHENGFTSFIYYTMLSNTFAALSAAFVFPYTVEGVQKKRFTLPKWVSVLHYMATVSITITMVFVLAFMSWASPENAFGGANLVTHVFCPLLILISFFQMESGTLFTWKERVLGAAPFCLYLIVYLIEAVAIGEVNGGWPDIYHITEFISPFLAVPLMLLFAFGTGTAIALLSNNLTKKRSKMIYMLWHEDLDPVEVRIEAYEFGRMASQHGGKDSVQIPYDILNYLAERYHFETEDLMKPLVKGLIIGFRERNNKESGSTGRQMLKS